VDQCATYIDRQQPASPGILPAVGRPEQSSLFSTPLIRCGGRMGRPAKWSKRQVVDAILYVAATGCQWRALPPQYPHWNTVHRYHLTWSRDGTWEKIVDRLRGLVRDPEGRDPDPSASVIDARSVVGTSTVGSSTRGYDAAKKVSGRKVFGLVDTTGLLLGVVFCLPTCRTTPVG